MFIYLYLNDGEDIIQIIPDMLFNNRNDDSQLLE